MPRRLGQHFLTDIAILDRIVDAIDPRPDDVVVEIGAGKGTLTARLAARVGRVVAIEKDRTLAAVLAGGGKGEGKSEGDVRVLQADALDLDWRQASLSMLPGFKVVGNIPYYITSPLIEKALTPPLPSLIVFLVQKEVADRLAAPPGTRAYGALSVGVQVAARVERLFVVKAGAFRPPPRVDSAVVRLTPLPAPLVPPDQHAGFRAFVTALFGARRKQIARALRVISGAGKVEVERALAAAGIGLDPRPEVLSPQELVRLWRAGASLTPSGRDV